MTAQAQALLEEIRLLDPADLVAISSELEELTVVRSVAQAVESGDMPTWSQEESAARTLQAVLDYRAGKSA